MSPPIILFIFIVVKICSPSSKQPPIDLQWARHLCAVPSSPPEQAPASPSEPQPKGEGGREQQPAKRKNHCRARGCAPCDGYCAACDGGSQDVSGAAVGVHLMGHDNQMKTALGSCTCTPASRALARDSVTGRPLNYWPTEAYAEPRSATIVQTKDNKTSYSNHISVKFKIL